MEHLPAAGRAWMPWKNGGGKTMQVAVYPEAAGMDDFAWRISIATVTQAGPFSIFAGMDRTLAILEGAGLELTVGKRPIVVLTTDSEPLSFAADQPVMARPLGNAVTDLNVMVRRGHWRHAMQKLVFAAASRTILDLPPAVVVWVRGHGRMQAGSEEIHVKPFDAVRAIDAARWEIAADGPALAYVISFEPAG